MEIVVEDQGPTRLDRLLRKLFGHFPQSLIECLTRKKRIKVNNKAVKALTLVSKGDIIVIRGKISGLHLKSSDNLEKPDFSPSVIRLAEDIIKKYLIFSCNEFIAINKPCGLAVQGGSKILLSIDDALKYLNTRRLERAGGSNEYKLVHRLDKDTSGILIIASNIHSARALGKGFNDKALQKTYLAICAKDMRRQEIKDKGYIESYMDKNKSGTYEVVTESPDGKLAKTLYEVISKQDQFYVIKYTPLTGRIHQLRFHSKQLGCPILGDIKYGGPKYDRMMLHALKLVIPANIFGKKYIIHAPVDHFFERFYQKPKL